MSFVLARQGDNKTLDNFKEIIDYCNDSTKIRDTNFSFTFGCITDNPFAEMISLKKITGKTDGRQYTHIAASPTPVGNPITDEEFMEMAKEIGKHYYSLGFQCNVTVHFDTGKRHIHLVINSVSLKDSRKFSQSISQLNKFKLHCNRVFSKYGFDIIKSPTEKMLDNREYSFSNGYDFLEAYDEIAEDIAFNFYDAAENESMAYCLEVPKTTSYNPDAPVDGYNRFFANVSETYRDYYRLSQMPIPHTLDLRNAWSQKSELRPLTPFNTANISPTIYVQNQSPANYGTVDYFAGITGPCMHIDNRRIVDVYVPETVNLMDLYSVFDRIPTRSEKEKNDAVRSAAAAKAALNRADDNSKVSIDVSEHIRIHLRNDSTTPSSTQNQESDIIDVVDFEEKKD